MTGHKKQRRGRRSLEKYGKIERVRTQHLPRVATSPQGVLTTAVLAVRCSACDWAARWHSYALNNLKRKGRQRGGTSSQTWTCFLPLFFAHLTHLVFFFYYLSIFSLSLPQSTFVVRLLCWIRAAKWKQQFSAKFPHYEKLLFFPLSVSSQQKFYQLFVEHIYRTNKWLHKHVL